MCKDLWDVCKFVCPYLAMCCHFRHEAVTKFYIPWKYSRAVKVVQNSIPAFVSSFLQNSIIMSAKLIASVVAGVCGTIFLGYCVYFDHKRRSDPDFKKKLREKRRQQKRNKKDETDAAMKGRMPDMSNTAAVQAFFIQEVQLGEELLAQGEQEAAVKHFISALAVCGQPHQLLQMFQQTLPPNVFQMLLDNIQGMKAPTEKDAEEGESLD